jgi:hypothetical protein
MPVTINLKEGGFILAYIFRGSVHCCLTPLLWAYSGIIHMVGDVMEEACLSHGNQDAKRDKEKGGGHSIPFKGIPK